MATPFTRRGTTSRKEIGEGFLRRLDASGAEIWTRRFDEGPRSLVVWRGGVYVVGSVNGSDGLPQRDPTIRKYDSAGNLLWRRAFGTSVDEEPFGAAAGGDGGDGVWTTSEPSRWQWRGHLTLFDADGAEVWTRDIDRSALYFVAADSTSIYISGAFIGDRVWDAFVRKYHADGS